MPPSLYAHFSENKKLQVGIMLVVALLFGGGGSQAGFCNLIVQLTSLFFMSINYCALTKFFKNAPKGISLLIILTLFLPVVQVIPLPPMVWQNLPGRLFMTESLAFLEMEEVWRPLSIEFHRTILAFLSLMPPLMILVLSWDLAEEDKFNLLKIVASSGVFVFLVGSLQISLGNYTLMFFAETIGSDNLHGNFANRNSTGLFLVISLCAIITVFPDKKIFSKWFVVCWVSAIFLIIGIILTGSRSSMALSIVPFVMVVFKVFCSQIIKNISIRALIISLCSMLVLAGGGLQLIENPRIQRSIARFDSFNDPRFAIWNDSYGAIKRFWPIGSGIGTFDEVFQLDESLENLDGKRAARAHNEYLEVSVEAGVIGIALIAVWMLVLSVACLQAIFRDKHLPQSSAFWAIAVFTLLALQSISDYPLRSQALLSVGGLMLAFLINIAPSGARAEIHYRTRYKS